MSSSKAVKCHRDMYKSRTPPWKEAYRKRCLDRLRDSREKLKCRFRNIKLPTDQDTIIEDLMREEWKSLRAEQGHQDLDIENEGSLEGVDIDQVLNLFEDIQTELRQEELRMLKEFEIFEESLHFEEKSLCSAIDKLSTDEVVCPLCKRNPLLINKSVIFCSCGMRINTEQDCLTLNNVKTLLERGLQEHSQGCEFEPSFSLISESGHTNLLMTCQQDCLTLNNVKTLLERGLQEHSQGCESEPSFSLISESGHTNLLMTCQACDWMSVVI